MDTHADQLREGSQAWRGTAAERDHVDSQRLRNLAAKMHDKGYRDAYVETHTRQVLARQMREFRRDMSQIEFASAIDKKQTVVSRLEDPSYTGWTLRTIFEIARKLNVAAFVRFMNFQTFLKYSGDMSEEALRPQPYDMRVVDAFARSFSGEADTRSQEGSALAVSALERTITSKS